LQRGNTLSMPHARPMPAIGPHCYELWVKDENKTWRIIYQRSAKKLMQNSADGGYDRRQRHPRVGGDDHVIPLA